MSDRYTSPALSRDLAAAGLEQNSRTASWAGDALYTPSNWSIPGAVRALDLTDCLHEIETRGATWLVETGDGMYGMTASLGEDFAAVMGGPTAVEAAGLCLLALLDKEREVKP